MPLAAEPTLTPVWPLIVVPVLLGGAAVYLLLPRPHPLVRWSGWVSAALALGAAGFGLIHAAKPDPETILFYAFAGLAVVAGGMLVCQKNPVHAALSFALVVLSTCGLFLLQAAPFLMAATIIVYAGAIVVTFLFVIMLAQQAGVSDADARSREPLLAALTGFCLLATLLFFLFRDAPAGVFDGRPAPRGGERFSTYSGPRANLPSSLTPRDDKGQPTLPAENVAALGRALFTDYLIPVEIGGTLLMVAVVGAIAISGRRAEGLR
jgi:NADH-quinone oxidoreductase subunit J